MTRPVEAKLPRPAATISASVGAEVAQVVGERGPSGGRVAEGEPVVVGEVGAEPFGEVERAQESR